MSPVGVLNSVSYAESAAVKPVDVSPSDQQSLIQAVNAVNSAQALGSDRELTFAIDRQTRRVIVLIVNSSTGEILDQIPNEQVQRLAEKLR